jgi:hypothetical protein
VNKINVSAGKGEKFAGAEPTKPGQDDQCSQSRANRGGQLENGAGIDYRPLPRTLNASSAKLAGVAGDPHVLHSGIENGPEEAVGLGGLIPSRGLH